MFNLEYVASEVGADIENSGDVFKTEVLTVADNKLTLGETAVPVVSGGSVYAWIRPEADGAAEMERKAVGADNKIDVTATAGTKYCVLYKYSNDAAKQITINAQFIPDTLHAVLTVALYSGDSCNLEASTKVGEVTIDIPRFQLSGAMDITSATC